MHPSRSTLGQFVVLWAFFTFLVVTYVIPAYPSTALGWVWLLGLSVPYCAVVGVSGHALRRAWPVTGLAGFAILVVAVLAIVLSTWGYFRMAGVL